MIDKFFVIFAIVSYVHVSICTIDGVAVDEKLELLRNDTEICPTGKFLFESRNAKACKDMRFLVENETLSEKNEQQFLCFGLYDRASRVCFMKSILQLSNVASLESTDTFDAGVETNFLNATTDVLIFCQNWKHTYPALAIKTLPYTQQLERVLKEVSTCVKMCAKFEVQLEPLCAVLASIDRILDKSAVAVGKPEQPGKDGEVDEGAAKVIDPGKSRDVIDADDDKKNAARTEKVQVQKPVEELTVAGNKSITRVETKVSASEVNSPALAPTKSTAASEQKPSESHTKQSDLGDTAQHIKMENNRKEGDKRENMGKYGEKGTESLLDGANTKDKLAKNSHIEHLQADGDPGPLGPDNSDEHTDKIAVPENEPGDDDPDFISEHTQNDDQPAGGRVPSENGEIESPIISASDEDLNETPAQAPIKHPYAPGMRAIRDDDDSHVFGYFTVIGVICVAGYIGYHNKQKILAMMLEGRRSRSGRGRRRPSTANYRKLDCNLEEAVTSQCTSNVTHVIY